MNLKQFRSSWDGRNWIIRDHIEYTTGNLIYMMKCEIHSDFLYIGSTINLKHRWANHKSSIKTGKNTSCKVADHVGKVLHPKDSELSFLKIIPIEVVKNTNKLLERELFWQANLGTLQCGFNERKDFGTILKNRIQF